MTKERDFDRLARAWLEPGPDEAPDRAIAAVLLAVETTPQVRPRFRWPIRRSINMNRYVLAASAATVLVVVIGGGILINRPTDRTGTVAATPSPTASASATPTAPASEALGEPVPASLIARWMGGSRPTAGIDPASGSSLAFTSSGFSMTPPAQTNNPLLGAVAASVGDTTIRLTTTSSREGRCAIGDTGTYTWSLSPSGRTLTIAAVADDCAARLGAVPGTWSKMACKDPNDSCLGDLEVGAHESQFFAPRVDPGVVAAPEFGALTYTVPDGWANRADWPTAFGLTPSSDYVNEPASGPPPDTYHGIYLFTQPAASNQTADCNGEVVTTTGRTVKDLVAWVQSRPSLIVSDAASVTIDGHDGQMIDVRLDPSSTGTCPDVSGPISVYLTDSGSAADDWTWGSQAGEQQRLIFLDLGDGDVVLIGIDSSEPDRYDELVAQAMPIIESFTFK
jgi:hypothetical protein